ncbi:hypothetical protein ACFW2V_12275 [Streptomyces sp. NPDC058947]|uniref:hypothetical protein n=1 Tax=Streptomyces sp. NPDC058947 TaxID=3346675 RepID=UPI0036BAB57D
MTIKTNPWVCHDCGTEQGLIATPRGPILNSSGWYRVQLRPDEKPVYLDKACFDSYDDDWPDYVGTHESSPWQGGEWEGKWLWVLPADYFVRRDAYRRLPRWERDGSGYRLVTEDGWILGLVQGYGGDARKRGLYKPLTADREPIGEPMTLTYAKGAVHVYLGLGGPGMVQR